MSQGSFPRSFKAILSKLDMREKESMEFHEVDTGSKAHGLSISKCSLMMHWPINSHSSIIYSFLHKHATQSLIRPAIPAP